MENEKIGTTIRQLRLERGMTQKQLAEALFLSDKAISKWERGAGVPDISVIGHVASILGVDLSVLLAGSLDPNMKVGGNMNASTYYVCPTCHNLSVCTGNAQVTCCGRPLTPLELKKANPNQELTVTLEGQEWYVTCEHPMTKENYIMFVALVNGSFMQLVKLYPEWGVNIRFIRQGYGRLLWYTPQDGLLYQWLRKS